MGFLDECEWCPEPVAVLVFVQVHRSLKEPVDHDRWDYRKAAFETNMQLCLSCVRRFVPPEDMGGPTDEQLMPLGSDRPDELPA